MKQRISAQMGSSQDHCRDGDYRDMPYHPDSNALYTALHNHDCFMTDPLSHAFSFMFDSAPAERLHLFLRDAY
jgi:hypothetical protein